MDDLIIYLIFAAVAVACFAGYYVKWCCCDAGILPNGSERSEVQSKRQSVERKMKQQIRKMVEAEREAKRLAAVATNGTGEDANEFFETILNLLFPVQAEATSRPPLPTSDVTLRMEPYDLMNPSSSPYPEDIPSTASYIEFHPSLNMMNSHAVDIDLNAEYESFVYSNYENDGLPSYEECMQKKLAQAPPPYV